VFRCAASVARGWVSASDLWMGGSVNRKGILMALALIVAACATETPAIGWQKPGAGQAELDAASDVCHSAAMTPDLGVDNDRMQAQARANTFVRCMRENGWTQVQIPPAD
jgi:hypothetical protein